MGSRGNEFGRYDERTNRLGARSIANTVVVDLYRPSTYEIIARWRAHAAGLIVLTFDRPSSRGTKVPIGRESAFSRTSADPHTADFIRSPFPRQMPSPRERVLPLTPIYTSFALRRKVQREDGENRSFPTCFDRTPRLITAPGRRIRTACNDFHSNAFRPLLRANADERNSTVPEENSEQITLHICAFHDDVTSVSGNRRLSLIDNVARGIESSQETIRSTYRSGDYDSSVFFESNSPSVFLSTLKV